MSAVSNWQIYHLTRDQERKSEGQKYNIHNTVSRWMHSEDLIYRSLKSLSEECLQHIRAAVTGVFSIRLQYAWILSPSFPSIFLRNSKHLEIYVSGIVCHARHTHAAVSYYLCSHELQLVPQNCLLVHPTSLFTLYLLIFRIPSIFPIGNSYFLANKLT